MKSLFAAALLTFAALGCATIPQTRIYRQAEGTISDSLCVLPVIDNTPERSITQPALNSLRDHLATSLQKANRFRSIQLTDTAESSKATLIECKVTQCDTSARRMSVVAEIRTSYSAKPFMRMVAHTVLLSIAWPIDYIAVMERAGKAVADDLTRSIVNVYDEEKTKVQ